MITKSLSSSAVRHLQVPGTRVRRVWEGVGGAITQSIEHLLVPCTDLCIHSYQRSKTPPSTQIKAVTQTCTKHPCAFHNCVLVKTQKPVFLTDECLTNNTHFIKSQLLAICSIYHSMCGNRKYTPLSPLLFLQRPTWS